MSLWILFYIVSDCNIWNIWNVEKHFKSIHILSPLQISRPRDNLKGVLPRRLMTLPRRLNRRRCLWQTHQTKVGHERNLVCGCQYPMTWLWHAIEYTNVMSMCILLIWLREKSIYPKAEQGLQVLQALQGLQALQTLQGSQGLQG